MRRVWALMFVVSALILPAQPVGAQEDVETHQLTITTVPVVRGMVVDIDGKAYESDGGGIIRASLTTGVHQLTPRPNVSIDENTRYLFSRWNDRFEGAREINLKSDRDLQVGVLIQYDTGLRFADGLGQPFPADRVESVVLINSNGDLTTVSHESAEDDEGLEIGSVDHIWMTANRLRRTGAGLISKEAVYSARQVFVNGENVVQSGKVEFLPRRGATWELELRLYGLLVDVRSFGFGRPVAGEIGIRKAGEDEPFQISETVGGVAEFVNIPVGDFELTSEKGGWAPAAPVVFSGPKTEFLTVVTPWVRWFAVGLFAVSALSFGLFLLFDRWRIRILLAWAAVLVMVMNVPTIGALGGRPLSLEASPVFDVDGGFIGISATVYNTSAFPVSQVYCDPDFELRVLEGEGVWSASYESRDFHDVEFGECREHKVWPGEASYLLAPSPGEEWSTMSDDPLPPGEYVAYVRLFDVPAPAIRLELIEAINPAEDYYVWDDPTLGSEIPFTSPFEE